MNPQRDPIIDEVRETRHAISERFGHDPAKLVAYYMQMQEHFRDRLVRRGTQATPEVGKMANAEPTR